MISSQPKDNNNTVLYTELFKGICMTKNNASTYKPARSAVRQTTKLLVCPENNSGSNMTLTQIYKNQTNIIKSF